MYEVSELAADAHRILTAWQNQYELYYISARGENVFDITKNWFDQFKVPYDHIECIGSHNKIAIAKKHAVEAFSKTNMIMQWKLPKS